MPGSLIVGFALVAGGWGLTLWRLAVEAQRMMEDDDDR